MKMSFKNTETREGTALFSWWTTSVDRPYIVRAALARFLAAEKSEPAHLRCIHTSRF